MNNYPHILTSTVGRFTVDVIADEYYRDFADHMGEEPVRVLTSDQFGRVNTLYDNASLPQPAVLYAVQDGYGNLAYIDAKSSKHAIQIGRGDDAC